MHIINIILKNKRAFITELCFLGVFLLLPVLYIYNMRCNYYDEMIDYKERYEGKIVKFKQPETSSTKATFSFDDLDDFSFAPPVTPPVTGIKDGDIVWVSGIMKSKDSLNIPIRNSDGKVVRTENFKTLKALYTEMEVKSGKFGTEIEHETYEKRFSADEVTIGAMPIDTALLSSHIESSTCVAEYNVYGWTNYRIKIHALPDTAISCIGRYIDGKLTFTEHDDPFIYSLKEGVGPEELINSEVERKKANVESMETKLKYVSMTLLVLATGLLLSRRRSDKTKQICADETVLKKLSRLNLMRLAVLSISMIIPLIGLLICCIDLRHKYAESLSLTAFAVPIVICFTIHLIIVYILGKILVYTPYERDILYDILAKNGEIRRLTYIPFNPTVLSDLGSSPLKPLDLVSSEVSIRFENSYALTISNGSKATEVFFFEANVKKKDETESSMTGKIYVESTVILDTLCLIIPLDIDENVKLNIEPDGHLSSSNMKIRYKEDLNNRAYPENMKIYTNQAPESDEFLTSTPFLDNVRMMIGVIKEKLGEEYLVFSVHKKKLYVFIYTSLKRFKVSLYNTINYETIRHDIDTVDAFREIGKRWK